jgi:hypothetical protein
MRSNCSEPSPSSSVPWFYHCAPAVGRDDVESLKIFFFFFLSFFVKNSELLLKNLELLEKKVCGTKLIGVKT